MGAVSASELTAFVNFSSLAGFEEDEMFNYIEVYTLIPGTGVKYVEVEGGLQGAIEYTFEVFLEDSLVYTQRYMVQTKLYPNEDAVPDDVVDINRFNLIEGKYQIVTSLRDHNDTLATNTFFSTMEVNGYTRDIPAVSDPTLMLSIRQTNDNNLFTRHGVEMIPYALDFYPSNMSQLNFYTEIYNMDQELDESFLVQYAIEEKRSGRVQSSGFRKCEPDKIVPVTGSLDLSQIPSGNYFLSISVKNRDNELLLKKNRFFFRTNNAFVEEVSENVDSLLLSKTFAGKMPIDSVKLYALSLYPIATQVEESTMLGLVESNDTASLRKYFYLFWERRDEVDPRSKWIEYKQQVDLTLYNFTTPILKGFDTDRGRVWLEYGQPNDIQYGREPNARDYEVWQYYSTIDKQNNVIFVFMNPFDVVNDYVIIHSTAQGETFNDRWKVEIYNTFADPNGATDIDVTNPNNTPYGTKSGQFFDDF